MRWLLAALVPLDVACARTAVWLAHGALAMLIVSGEAIRWLDYRDTMISVPLLRAVHAMGGFALAAALLARIGRWAVHAQFDYRARRRVPAPTPSFNPQSHLTAGAVLDGAWWAVVGLLVLSGLERYSRLRHGIGLLPGLPPPAWWALHQPLLPFLYTVLLLNVLIRGRMTLKRAVSYLYTP